MKSIIDFSYSWARKQNTIEQMFFNFRRLHFSSTIGVVSQPTIVSSYNFWTVKYTAIHKRPTIFLDASYNPSVMLSYQRKKIRKQHLNQGKCFHFIFFTNSSCISQTFPVLLCYLRYTHSIFPNKIQHRIITYTRIRIISFALDLQISKFA